MLRQRGSLAEFVGVTFDRDLAQFRRQPVYDARGRLGDSYGKTWGCRGKTLQVASRITIPIRSRNFLGQQDYYHTALRRSGSSVVP